MLNRRSFLRTLTAGVAGSALAATLKPLAAILPTAASLPTSSTPLTFEMLQRVYDRISHSAGDAQRFFFVSESFRRDYLSLLTDEQQPIESPLTFKGVPLYTYGELTRAEKAFWTPQSA